MSSWRSSAPQPSKPLPYAPPGMERLGSLQAGLGVYAAEAPGSGLVTVTALIRAGEASVPEERGGVAAIAAALLDGGTRKGDARRLAGLFADIGATFASGVGLDSTTASLTLPRAKLKAGLALLGEVLADSVFPTDEFERRKARALAGRRQRLMDPEALASEAFRRLIYAHGDPYGRPVGGSRESLSKMEAGDARAFASAAYRPSKSELALAGDLPPEAFAMAQDALGGWLGDANGNGAPFDGPPARAGAFGEGGLHLIDRAGSPQSVIRMGHAGFRRSSPDFLGARILSVMLGGSFASCLNLVLRERLGLTYGVSSSFAANLEPGPFVVSTSVETEGTRTALDEIRGRTSYFWRHGAFEDPEPGQIDLETAKKYLAGVFPLYFQTTRQVASRLAGLLAHRLPLDAYAKEQREILERDHFPLDRLHRRLGRMVSVVVGDAKRVMGQLAQEDRARVQLHDPEEFA